MLQNKIHEDISCLAPPYTLVSPSRLPIVQFIFNCRHAIDIYLI